MGPALSMGGLSLHIGAISNQYMPMTCGLGYTHALLGGECMHAERSKFNVTGW